MQELMKCLFKISLKCLTFGHILSDWSSVKFSNILHKLLKVCQSKSSETANKKNSIAYEYSLKDW